jgi:hypothetical protein
VLRDAALASISRRQESLKTVISCSFCISQQNGIDIIDR